MYLAVHVKVYQEDRTAGSQATFCIGSGLLLKLVSDCNSPYQPYRRAIPDYHQLCTTAHFLHNTVWDVGAGEDNLSYLSIRTAGDSASRGSLQFMMNAEAIEKLPTSLKEVATLYNEATRQSDDELR